MAGSYESGMNMVGNIDGAAIASPEEWAEAVIDQLGDYNVLRIKNVPPDTAAETYGSLVDSLCESAGATTNGWSDIKATPGAQNYNRPRRFHTDGAANVSPIDVVVMYCEKPAEEGGSNIFLDAASLYGFLGNRDPDLRAAIESTEILFEHKGKSRRSPIFVREEEQIKINWDEGKVSEQNSEKSKELALRFSAVLKEYETIGQNLSTVALSSGEGIVWWDQSVLHARAPVVSSGVTERFLRTATLTSIGGISIGHRGWL